MPNKPVSSYGCVYLVTNVVNGKVYVGQTIKPIQARWAGHLKKAREGTAWPLLAAIRKYGPDAFTVAELERCAGAVELDAAEARWVAEFRSNTKAKGYNCTSGGGSRHEFTASSKAKMSASHQARWRREGEHELQSARLRKRFQDPKARQVVSFAAVKRWADPAVREKQSIKCKSHWQDAGARAKQSTIKKAQYEDNSELRSKIAEANRRRMMDPEARRRLSEKAKAQWADPELRRQQAERKRKLYEDPVARAQLQEAGRKGLLKRWGADAK